MLYNGEGNTSPYQKNMRTIKFIKSPIGAFNLAYSEGMEAVLNENQAEILVESGYAIYLDSVEIPEKPIQKENRKSK